MASNQVLGFVRPTLGHERSPCMLPVAAGALCHGPLGGEVRSVDSGGWCDRLFRSGGMLFCTGLAEVSSPSCVTPEFVEALDMIHQDRHALVKDDWVTIRVHIRSTLAVAVRMAD